MERVVWGAGPGGTYIATKAHSPESTKMERGVLVRTHNLA